MTITASPQAMGTIGTAGRLPPAARPPVPAPPPRWARRAAVLAR